MLVRPKEAFVVDSLTSEVIGPNMVLDDSDPLVQSRPEMFEPISANYSTAPLVEDTRAEPGVVKRGPGRPRKIQ